MKSIVFAASVAGLCAGSAQAVTMLDVDAYGNYGRKLDVLPMTNTVVGTIHSGSQNADAFHVGRNYTEFHNGYMVFDLSNTNADTVQASIDIKITGYMSPDATETISLFGVSTDLADLLAGTGTPNAAGTFDDLGTFASLGSASIAGTDVGSTITINLNALGVAAINDASAAGSDIAFGAALTSLFPEDSAGFDYWNQELIWGEFETGTLTTDPMPEPSSTMLLGLGGLGVILRRKRS